MSDQSAEVLLRRELAISYAVCVATALVTAGMQGLVGAYDTLACAALISAVVLAAFHSFWAIPAWPTAGLQENARVTLYYRATMLAASVASGLIGVSSWLWWVQA